jgi:hypothetical protein
VHSAEVGNALRATASEVKAKYIERFHVAMRAAETFLVARIEADDEHLLHREKH